MARSIRIELPGAFYHVMARGNRREAIFRDDDDRRFFLKTLGEACPMTGWRVHAWVLLGNHYYVALETPGANLTAGMQWLQNIYTVASGIGARELKALPGSDARKVAIAGAIWQTTTVRKSWLAEQLG